jgi:hypothetical protein
LPAVRMIEKNSAPAGQRLTAGALFCKLPL